MSKDIYSGLKLNMSLYADMFSQIQPSLARFSEISETLNSSILPVLQTYNQMDLSGINRIVDSMRPIVELYSSYDQMNAVAESARRIAETMLPVSQQVAELSANIPDMSGLNEVIQRIVPVTHNYSEMVLNLQNALSIWDFSSDELYEEEFDDILDDLEDAIQTVCDGTATSEQINKYGTKWKEKIKKIIWTILQYILLSLALPSLYDYVVSPVYKTIKEVVFYREQDETSSDKNIDKDTELEIWSDDLNQDYIEISYRYEGETIAGYIKRTDLEDNTIKVSEGVSVDEVLFVSRCTDLMADYWAIEAGEAYQKLNDETTIVEDYIVKNYDALSKMSDSDVVNEIVRVYEERASQDNTKEEQ